MEHRDPVPDDQQVRQNLNKGRNSCTSEAVTPASTGPTEVAGHPLGPPEEDILYADIDYGQILAAKNAYDPTGHYSRPDELRLLFNPAPAPRIVRTERLDAAAAAQSGELVDAEQPL